MNVTGKTRIYRKEWENGRVSYSRPISSREFVDGHKTDKWITAYEQVQLPKGANVADKEEINVTKGFESTYRRKDGNVERKLIVLEYESDEPAGFDEIETPF